MCCRDVFDSHAQRLEQRHIGGGLPAGDRSRCQLAELARDVRRVNCALVDRQHEIPGF